MKKPKRQLRLIALEDFQPPHVESALIAPGPPHLSLLRRIPHAFVVPCVAPDNNYWMIQILNENQALEYAGQYVVEIPKKSKLPPWTPEDLAIECAKRLNEFRGLVTLQEHTDGICSFAAVFASNSLWTFCVWSTDPQRCPTKKATPDGWRRGQELPKDLPHVETKNYPPPDCHHPETDKAKISKMAQRQFA